MSAAPVHSGCMRAASRLPNEAFLDAVRPPQGRAVQRLPIASLSSAIQYLVWHTCTLINHLGQTPLHTQQCNGKSISFGARALVEVLLGDHCKRQL